MLDRPKEPFYTKVGNVAIDVIGKHREWSTVKVYMNELVDPTPMDYGNAKRVTSLKHLCFI